ncbi:MAG TPA: assimilatory sulfite reductase (NADPH) hemoprotein subunit [Prolixibacteraceae bacterium]|nr:assimilatory sulfite reductase (NADPH) hemoprotein subunit [Prolixibacteraceae bacterium]
MEDNNNISAPPSPIEIIKENSNYLRGTITESLNNPLTGSMKEQDQVLIKFHGTYQQQDRDLDDERKHQKLEPLYSFLIRIRVPAGITTPAQWLALDELSDKYADKTFKFTTRQAFQFHGVLKRNLKTTMHEINNTLLDTLAACGDVNRNVMTSANPFESPVHAEVAEDAKKISAYLTPQTAAYHEIWLDGKLVEGGEKEEEPLYGKTYLPRKFKTAIAIPPRNDSDVLSNDLGFIAIIEKGQLAGYNVTVGGGMAYTFGNNNTYPRVADVVGYIPKEKIVEVSEAVLIFQRDHGNRSDRKNARLKYTIDRLGLDYFRSELKRTHNIETEAAKPYKFTTLGDKYGWSQSTDGYWHYTVFVEGGKLVDRAGYPAKTAIREVAKIHTGSFILTGNQNVVIAQVSEKQKAKIENILKKHNVVDGKSLSQLRQNSIACAALPLCGLAFAEAERYLPSLVDKLDKVLEANGLLNEPISIRMTGCPNGCGRPFLAEIGLVGRAPGRYNLYLGASFVGDRLNKLYKEMLSEEEIIVALTPILEDFAKTRDQNEHFGNFVIRNGYVKATTEGKKFHD